MATASIAATASLTTQWQRQLGSLASYSDAQVVSVASFAHFSYFGSCGSVFQLDVHGLLLSVAPISNSEIRFAMPPDGSQLFVGTNGQIYSVAPAVVQSQNWVNNLPGGGNGVVNSIYYEGTLYVGAGGNVFAVDPNNGNTLSVNTLPGFGSGEVNLAISSDGKLLYAGAGGQVVSLIRNTFAVQSANNLAGGGQGVAHLLSTASALFVGTGGSVWALDPADLETQVAFNGLSGYGNGEVRFAISGDQSKLYVGVDGQAVQLDSATLNEQASNSLPNGGTGVVNLLTSDACVYAGAGGMIYRLSPNGLQTQAENDLPGLGQNEVRLAVNGSVYAGILQAVLVQVGNQTQTQYVGRGLDLLP